MTRLGAALLAALLAASLASGAHAQGAAKWADPAKVLRTAIVIAETGFDPQAAQDFYSNTINSAIFDPLYEYDYLARPHRIVPRAAEALPEISPDGLVWKIRIRKGVYFADDPVFKGARRELTAHDFVYAMKRLIDPRMRSPNVFLLRGRLAGLDDAVAKAKPCRPARLRRGDRRAARARPLHAAAEAGRARLHVPAGADGHADRGRRARGDREVRRRERLGDGQSGRHRPVPARRMAPRAAHRARSQPELPRGDVSRAARERRRRRARRARGDEGQAPAAGRARRDRGDRGVESAPARVQRPRARPGRRAARPRDARASTTRTACCRRTRRRARRCSARRRRASRSSRTST